MVDPKPKKLPPREPSPHILANKENVERTCRPARQSELSTQVDAKAIAEERGLCYGVKRGAANRSGTSQNPQTPTPNLTPTKNNKSHVL